MRHDDDNEEIVVRIERPPEEARDESFIQGETDGDGAVNGAGDELAPGDAVAEGSSLA